MLNLEELEQLVAFADCGTLSKVAEKYHISTPSITRSMQNLEESFGVPLFCRSKNRITLNETGEVAVTYARKLLQEAEQTLNQVRAFDERRRTIVVRSCAPAPLWKLLKQLDSSHPGMTVSSGICQNAEVLQAVKQETCDFAILPYPVDLPGWKTEECMKERLFVCTPEGHELAGNKELHWSDLNGFNFLLRTELGFWDTLCRENMPASKFLVQTEDSVFDELVKASTLPCFTTDYISETGVHYPGRENIPLADADAQVTFYLMTRK